MNVEALIDGLHRRGVRLCVNGEMLHWSAPKGNVTEVDLATLRKHKAELLAALAAPDPDGFEERAGLIHEAHTRTIADDGILLSKPIFEITQEQAATIAAQEQGHADTDSLHGKVVRRWAAEIERLAELKAVSPDGAKALKWARAFIGEGWALQAVRLGWDEVRLFGICPRATWRRLDRRGVAFGGAVQAVTADAVAYVGNLRRYRVQVNNDGGAVPIWELADTQTENVETHQSNQ